MIVLVLGDEEGQQVLDRLLSSQVPQQHACACQQGSPEVPAVEPPAPEEDGDLPLWSGQPWTAEEDAAISGCASPLLARRAYRRAFPHSDRTNDAIKARLLALKRARKEEAGSDAIAAGSRNEPAAEQQEVEVITHHAEPEDPGYSEIPPETEEQDLSRLDPALAGLSDASAPGRRECTGKEVTLCAKPEPEKKVMAPSPSGKGSWTDEEREAIYLADTSAAAWGAYRGAFPDSVRTEAKVKAMWSYLQKKGWNPSAKVPKAEEEGDKPLPLHTRVRILLQGSKYSGCEGEIVRQTQNPGEYVVVPDGACARFVMTRKDLEVLL